jgi:hypothetical protein
MCSLDAGQLKEKEHLKTRQAVREATADFMILDKVSEEGRCNLCILVGTRDDTALNWDWRSEACIVSHSTQFPRMKSRLNFYY